MRSFLNMFLMVKKVACVIIVPGEFTKSIKGIMRNCPVAD